jgi:N-acetylgalactosamine-N,N'-diacetylbacillosaminyl-diphospho-undecaprenol 4-alpha-N-acetylgalactosaminyltransferase
MKPKKRVVFLAYSMSGGGLESQIATLTNAFSKLQEVDATLLLWNNEIGFDTSISLINLELLFPGSSIWVKIKKYLFIKNYLKEEKIEVIIDLRHRTKPWLEVILSYYLFTIPAIATVHSIDLKSYGFQLKGLVPWIFNQNKHLVCVSRGIENQIRNQYPQIKSVQTIYNIVNPPLVDSNISINLPEKYLLYAGRIHSPEKQVKELIKCYATSQVYKYGVHLVLLGWNGSQMELHQLAENLKISDFVHIYSFQKNIGLFYKNALFTVLCSKWEGFGLTLVESLLCETPVVSFDCACGPTEIIMDGVNGILVENQNFDALSKVIMELFVNEEKLNQLKKNTLLGLEKFSETTICKQWVSLVNRL